MNLGMENEHSILYNRIPYELKPGSNNCKICAFSCLTVAFPTILRFDFRVPIYKALNLFAHISVLVQLCYQSYAAECDCSSVG